MFPHAPFSAFKTRVIIVDFQSQAGESPSTGVGLSTVYAGFKAKVENSISIMEVQSRRTAYMMDREPKPAPFPVGTRLRYVGETQSYTYDIDPKTREKRESHCRCRGWKLSLPKSGRDVEERYVTAEMRMVRCTTRTPGSRSLTILMTDTASTL
jgi:hypothetical protein